MCNGCNDFLGADKGVAFNSYEILSPLIEEFFFTHRITYWGGAYGALKAERLLGAKVYVFGRMISSEWRPAIQEQDMRLQDRPQEDIQMSAQEEGPVQGSL